MQSCSTTCIGSLSTILTTTADEERIRTLASQHDAIIGAENLLIDIEAIENEPRSFFDQAIRLDGTRIHGNPTLRTLLDDLRDTQGTYVLGTCVEQIGTGIYALSSPIITNGTISLRRKLTPLPEVSSYEESGSLLGGPNGAQRFKHVWNLMEGPAAELHSLIRQYHQLAGATSLGSVEFGSARMLPLICSDAERSIALYTGERVGAISYLCFNAHTNETDLKTTLTRCWHELKARELTTRTGILAYAHGGDLPMTGVIHV